MKKRIFVAALGLLICIAALLLLYGYVDTRVDTSTIEYIESLQTSPNVFVDLANDINVSSANDIGFIVEGDYHILIYYGGQIIDMTKNCFESEEYKQLLRRIGIKVYTHVNDDASILYKVTYWDEEVEQYSRVD